MNKCFFGLLLILLPPYALAQRQKTLQASVWLRYTNILELPGKFKFRSELENRIFIQPEVKEHQLLVRNQAEKHFKKGWHLGLGFVYFANGVNNTANSSTLFAPELRPYLEAGYKQAVNDWFNITHRYRAEWRFQHNTNTAYTELEPGFRNNFRFRYQFSLEFIPYKNEDRELRVRLADELMVNAGKNISRNIFDQNRLMAAVQFNVNEHIGFEAWYIFWMQQNGNGDQFFSRQILRLGLISNFDLSDKKSTKEK